MTARPPQGRRPGSAPRRPDAARRDQVVAHLTPVVAAVGLELEDVELRSVGRRLVVRVLVDSDHGVSLDEVASASRAVSDSLDDSDVLGDEPYTLEVSSPGVDRPLTLPRHWRRNVGRLVAVTTAKGEQVTGRIGTLTDTDVELEINQKGRIIRRTLALSEIVKALVQVEFSRVATADLGPEDESGDDGGDDSDGDDDEHDEHDDEHDDETKG
jgi:ribosome maturation factor RimP